MRAERPERHLVSAERPDATSLDLSLLTNGRIRQDYSYAYSFLHRECGFCFNDNKNIKLLLLLLLVRLLLFLLLLLLILLLLLLLPPLLLPLLLVLLLL